MFGKVLRKSLLPSFLVISAVLVPLSMTSSEVFAQRCQVFQFNANYPPTVAPGQTFQVTSTISLACFQWRSSYYGGRVDIVDPGSNYILSISTFMIGVMPSVTATVSNSVTAPQILGSWDLQLILYIFDRGGIVESFNRPVNVQVRAQGVSTPQQTTSTVSTTSSRISTTSSQTTGLTAVASETITMTTTSHTAPLGYGGPLAAFTQNSLIVIAVLVLLVILLATLAMRASVGRSAPQQIGLSQVFCSMCGARNPLTDEFCVSCGNKLERRK